MGHLGQDRETHSQRQSTIAQHKDLLPSDATARLRTAEIHEEEPCQVRCRYPGETQFDVLERRGLLDRGRAGHAYGFPALYLGLARPIRVRGHGPLLAFPQSAKSFSAEP